MDKVEDTTYYEVFRDDVSIGTTSDTYFADLSVLKEHTIYIR